MSGLYTYIYTVNFDVEKFNKYSKINYEALAVTIITVTYMVTKETVFKKYHLRKNSANAVMKFL